ncbi:hypothetical protein A2U01_0105897, partial [Trifolium medium]|nr:hypothetical protein [Trifolium medium]
GNTVDNPIKEACKAVGERVERTEEEKNEKRERCSGTQTVSEMVRTTRNDLSGSIP